MIPKVERELRITALAILNFGLRLKSNWDIKDERLVMGFKCIKYMEKREEMIIQSRKKSKGYLRKLISSYYTM